MATGVYILQENRTAFNQNQIDPVCLLCRKDIETLQHFIVHCEVLSSVRDPIMNRIINACVSANIRDLVVESPGRQLILDYTNITQLVDNFKCNHQYLKTLEFHCRRLCYSLHCERYKRLQLISKSNKCKNKDIP